MGLSGNELELQILELFINVYYILRGSTVSGNVASSTAFVASQGVLTSPMTTITRLPLRLLIPMLDPSTYAENKTMSETGTGGSSWTYLLGAPGVVPGGVESSSCVFALVQSLQHVSPQCSYSV